MRKKLVLGPFEQDLESNFDPLKKMKNASTEKAILQKVAKKHVKKKKALIIRISTADLEAIQNKASKIGLSYQTYINFIITS